MGINSSYSKSELLCTGTDTQEARNKGFQVLCGEEDPQNSWELPGWRAWC